MPSVHYLSREHAGAMTTDDPFGWPGTPEGWQARYQYLLDAYHGETYSEALIKDLQLFRALDDNGKVIGLTRRLYRDRVFLIEVAAAALAIGRVTLAPAEGASETDVAEARAIWQRSQMETQGDVWSQCAAIYGDLFVEPVRMSSSKPYGVELVSHDARTVLLEYDPVMGRRIDEAIITHDILGRASVDLQGHATESGEISHYQRTLNALDVSIERSRYNAHTDSREPLDGQPDAGSGAHGLGMTPIVHGRFTPSPMEPEHSLPVTHGLDRAEAEINSLASQISAVGDRYGNPKLLIKGVKVSEGADLLNLGKILNIYGGTKEAMANADARYLEPSLAGIGQIREQMIRLIEDVRATYPEHLFGSAGANLSGEALKMIATRYEVKYQGVRGRIYAAIERALSMGVAMAANRPYDPARHPVVLVGPPLLPADLAARLDVVIKAMDAKLLSRADAIAEVQGLDLAGDELTPEEYAAAIDAESAARTPAALMTATPAPDAPTTPADAAPPESPE